MGPSPACGRTAAKRINHSGNPVPKILSFIILLLVVCCGTTVFAADLLAEEQLRLQADTLQNRQNEDLIVASGHVELEWGSSRLFADEATYHRGSGLVEATGNVRLLKEGDVVTGDRARLQIDARTGVLTNGTIFLKQNNLHLRGKTIEKHGDLDYRVEQGSITTCDGDTPSWRFRVDDLQVTVEDFAYGRNAYFYLGDLPVFWFPYLLFPTKTERQSGFLLPKLGYSSKKGAFFEIPYYWALTPSQDLTTELDLETKRGAGVNLEHRYLSRNDGHGESKGFLFYDWEQQRLRGELKLKQQLNFDDDSYWRADSNITIGRDYYRDYGTVSGDYNRQYLFTSAFLARRFDSVLATAGVDYTTDLYTTNNKQTLQKLPYLSVSGSGARLADTPLYVSFASSLTHFEREQGARGERLLLNPELALQGAIADGIGGRLSAGYYQLGYLADDAGSANGLGGDGVFQAAATLRASFSRVYDSPVAAFTRLRHQLTPELDYRLTERKSLADLPFFDYDDRPLGGQLLTLALRNVVTGRSDVGDTPGYRDLLRFTLSQGYQLSGQRRELLLFVDAGRPFTDTALVTELLPLPGWRLFNDLRLSPYSGNLTNAALGVEVGEQGKTSASLNYHYASDKLAYLEGKATYADFRPYLFSASARYSFDRPGFLETLYAVEYKHQCWGLQLSYRDRIDNKELTLTFSLSGLGSFKLL